MVVPLALLGGQGVERAWRWVTDRRLWARCGRCRGRGLGLLVFFYLQIAAYARPARLYCRHGAAFTLYTTSTYLMLAVVALVLLVGLGAAAWIWRGPEIVVAGGWLAALVLLGLLGSRRHGV